MLRTLLALLIAAIAVLLLWQALVAAPEVPGPGPGGAADPTAPASATLPPVAPATADPLVPTPADEALPPGARLPAQKGSPAAKLYVHVIGADRRDRPGLLALVAPALAGDPWLEERTELTDAHGIARFELAPGPYVCRTPLGGRAEIELEAGTAATATIQLAAGATVAGRVVDADGNGIDGADVLAIDAATAARAHLVARTDGTGNFVLRDVGGALFVAVRHDRFAPSPPYRASPQQDGAALTIVLQRAAGTCRGVVVDAAGLAVPSALVVLGDSMHQYRAGDSRAFAPPTQQLLTDREGRFESRPLPPGTVLLQARAAGIGAARLEVAIGTAAADAVRVVLAPGATVRGCVRDTDGRPVAGAFVWNSPLRSFGCRIAATGADGSYELTELTPGHAALNAQRPPGPTTSTDLDLQPGAMAAWNPVLSTTPTASLHGRLVDAEDHPLVGWLILAIGRDEASGVGAESDASGRFEVRSLRGDAIVDVTVRRPQAGWTGFPDGEFRGVRVGGPELTLRIDPDGAGRGALSGIVLDGDDRPCRGTVRLSGTGYERIASYPLADNGAFAIDGVPAGAVLVEIDAVDLPRTRLPHLDLAAGARIDLGTIRVGRGGMASGSITDGDGRVPEQVIVRILDADGHDRGTAEVTAAGYRTQLLPIGDYTLLVQAPGCAPGRVRLAIAAGQDHVTDVVLAGGLPWRINVASREPAHASAKVSLLMFDATRQPLFFANKALHGGTTDFLCWLAPGDYALAVLGIDGFRAEARFAVPPGGDPAGATYVELQPPR